MFSGQLTSVPKPANQITVTDIKANFPLQGEYVFRCKTKHNKLPIFVDVLDESEAVPQFEGKIVIKANRVSWNTPQQTTVHVEAKGHVLDSDLLGHVNQPISQPKPVNHDFVDFI